MLDFIHLSPWNSKMSQYFGGYSVFYLMMDSQIVFGDCVSVLQETKRRNLALKWKNIKHI